MLLFFATARKALETIRDHGLESDSGEPILLSAHPPAASDLPRNGAILAVDTTHLVESPVSRNGRYAYSFVPPRAIVNLDPYLPVREIVAAGGYVVRRRPGSHEPDILVIYRRGEWDLPKGKLDPGETPEEGALREVREEAGIRRLELVRSLGSTVHGYVEKGTFFAKTTHWYAMTTEQESFVPEAKEGIERVEWMTWSKARQAVGYPNLRAHMDRLGMEALIP